MADTAAAVAPDDGIIREGEPLPDDCNKRSQIRVLIGNDIVQGYACWYPQMGGYAGKALVTFNNAGMAGTCFDVYVWHDGNFPFSGEISPRIIHHCDATQFIEFGEFLNSLLPPE